MNRRPDKLTTELFVKATQKKNWSSAGPAQLRSPAQAMRLEEEVSMVTVNKAQPGGAAAGLLTTPAAAMIPPADSLLKYDTPVLVSRNTEKRSPKVRRNLRGRGSPVALMGK